MFCLVVRKQSLARERGASDLTKTHSNQAEMLPVNFPHSIKIMNSGKFLLEQKKIVLLFIYLSNYLLEFDEKLY